MNSNSDIYLIAHTIETVELQLVQGGNLDSGCCNTTQYINIYAFQFLVSNSHQRSKIVLKSLKWLKLHF